MTTARLYEEMFATGGTRVTVQRQGGVHCSVRARVVRDGAEELVGGLDQSVRRVLVLAADVTFDQPLRRGDEIVMASGDLLTVELCDADTHREGDLLLAYVLTVQG